MKSLLYILLFPLLFLNLDANAQTKTDSLSHEKSIQLNIGTQGIGAEFKYGLTSNLALRFGTNIIPLKANNVFKVSGFNSTSKVTADFYNLHLLADYVPFESVSWLRISGGVAYFFKGKGDIRITPSDNYTYGDLILTEDQVGFVDLTVDWKGPAPYLGIGIGNIFPRKAFNVNFDLGTYYLNRPNADIIGTGILEGNSSQTGQFQSNIKNYRWLPVVQMNFTFKI